MKTVTCNDKAKIQVEDETDERVIEILKAAPAVAFSEFVYTGNNSRGRNSGNYEDLEAWLQASGLEVIEDDLSLLIYSLEKTAGIAALEHRGKRLRYHAQPRRGESNQFGYTQRIEYRLISCDRRLGGAKPGAGKPPATPGAGLAAALERAESSARAIAERGEIRYEEAATLFARIDKLGATMERVMVATPDYPDQINGE